MSRLGTDWLFAGVAIGGALATFAPPEIVMLTGAGTLATVAVGHRALEEYGGTQEVDADA
jgi:uncharacterized membrane protein YraQ (UPF0718 family)